MTPHPPPARAIRLVRPPSADGVGVFSVRDRAGCNFYALREIPCEIGGRGFAVHRLGLGVLYHVRVGAPAECSCDCPGFTFKGRCKHVLGLLALIGRGQL